MRTTFQRLLPGIALAPITWLSACTNSAGWNVVEPHDEPSITIAPNDRTLLPGESVRLAVVVRGADGTEIPDASITWASRSPGIIAINAEGIAEAIAPGVAWIVATFESVSDSAQVRATAASAPEPAETDDRLWEDAFDYPTVSALEQEYATRGTPQIIPGRDGGQAVRFPYSPSVASNLLEKTFSETTDLYVRYWYRLSPGADPTCGGSGDSGMKWFMAWRRDGPRYTNGVGNLRGGPDEAGPQAGLEFTTHDNSSGAQPNPFLQNVSKSPRFGTTNDGEWHRYALHIVTGNGGYEQIWIDGMLVLDNRSYAYDHDPGGIYMIQFPGLVVDGLESGCDFTIDVDDLVVWRK